MICRIGITCDFETITDKRGAEVPRHQLQGAYVDAVVRVGAMPWLIPHTAPDALAYLEGIDGLVISGGDFDIPPEYYGESPRAHLGNLNPHRSRFEKALLDGALAQNMPVLGVCGGMQLLNVALGGDLYQDLSERENSGIHQQPHDKHHAHHTVELDPQSRLARLAGTTTLNVNSTHHQVIRRLGRSVVASGLAEDGVIEAIEATMFDFAVGVQWHPEALARTQGIQALGVYQGLVDAARQFKLRRVTRS